MVHLQARAAGTNVEGVNGCRELLLILMPEVAHTNLSTQLRGVILIEQLAKWYVTCLGLVGQRMLGYNLPQLPHSGMLRLFA